MAISPSRPQKSEMTGLVERYGPGWAKVPGV
jgi:hypothetical protein